jgi:hypothetical protein
MGKLIRQILDLFYPLFARFFDKQTYYYAACGGTNLVSSWLFLKNLVVIGQAVNSSMS